MGKWEDLKKKWMERYKRLREKGDEKEVEKEVERTEKEKGSGWKTLKILLSVVVAWVLVIAPTFNSAFASATGGNGFLPFAVETPVSTYLGNQVGPTVGPAIANFGNTPISGVPLKFFGSQLGCWFGKSFVPAEVIKQQTYSPTKSWDECKKFLVKEKADEIGCTNCYSFSSVKLESLGVKQAVISVVVDTPEGKQYCRNVGGNQKCDDISPAKNPTLAVFYDSSKADLKGVNIDPTTNKILLGGVASDLHATVFPLDVRAFIPLSCTTKGFTPKAVFSYDYQASGSATVSLRKQSTGTAPVVQNPVTFPGPVKLDVIPRPRDFAFDRDVEISVTIVLRNAGSGDAKINSVTLKQNPPLQLQGKILVFNGCVGPFVGTATGTDVITIPPFVSILGQREESNSIVCSFTAENVKDFIIDPATFSFEATADYTYQITQKSEPVAIEEVLTCDIPTTGWRFLQLEKGKEPDATWTSLTYEDSSWQLVDLPSTGKCTECSQYYRTLIIPALDEGKTMTLNVASDDGAICFLNGHALWDENFINDEHSLGKRNPKYQCASDSSYDYCVQLPQSNTDSWGLVNGNSNIIACKVNNLAGDDIGFAISTDPKILSASGRIT